MGTWTAPKISGGMNQKQIEDVLARIVKDLSWLMNGNIDWKNIRAKSINADLLSVDKLSAISADLGKVIAGILIGAYISTADGTYPRIDFSSENDLLIAYLDPDNYISIDPDATGTPTLFFQTPAGRALMSVILGDFLIDTDNDCKVSAGRDVVLQGFNVKVPSWNEFVDSSSGETLQQALDDKADAGISDSVVVGNGTGGTKTLHFSDGVFIGAT